MKYINRHQIIALCLSLFTAAAIAENVFFQNYGTKSEATSLVSELSEKLLRFRVLANSDSCADQLQKNQVSSELVSLLQPLLSDCRSKQEATESIRDNLAYIEEQANRLAACYGTAYNVTCTLSSNLFPVKTYENLTFPAGEYDTLLVTIGSGTGSNWWCLAYPPLCFASEAYVAVPSSSDNALLEILGEETYQILSDSSGQTSSEPESSSEQTKEKKQAFCFRLFPFLNKLFQ